MKIWINEKGGIKLWLAFPTCWLANKTVAKIVIKALEGRTGPQPVVTKEQMERLTAEIRRMKRKHPRLILVDVRSSNGDIVKIKL